MSSHHWTLLPFVTGILVGLSVSTVFLVRPYTEHVVTNVYIDVVGAGGGAGAREERFQELMRELHPVSPAQAGPRLLRQELTMKGLVHYAVLVSEQEMVDTLRHTWTLNISENMVSYYVGVRGQAMAAETRPNVFMLPGEELEEIEILRHVCKHKINTTKWFFFGYDTSYVKTQELESYLLTLESSQDRLPYLGKPVKRESLGRLCLPGPGSVLSHQALTQLCPKLDGCSTMRAENLKSECVLGECLHKQLPNVQCNKEGSLHNLFLQFDATKRGPIIDPKNDIVFDQALTIYPVQDPKLMYNIHQLVVSQRLNDSQHFAQELKRTANQMTALLPRSEHTQVEDYREMVEMRTDIVSWNLINHKKLMSADSDDPATLVPALWRQELDTISNRAMEYLSASREDQQLVLNRIVNAYWRHHPLKGMEYVVDFETKSPPPQKGESSIVNRYCAHLSRSYGPTEVSPLQQQAKDSRRVTVALVMTGDQVDILQTFLKELSLVLDVDQKVDLIVVKMRTEREKQRASEVDLDAVLQPYETQYSRASFKVIHSPYVLSRPHGLAMVLHEVKPTDILFMADLYLTFNASFMKRCRHLPLQGQQAYYPIPFAVESNTNTEKAVSSASGHWLVKSRGTACAYAADVLSSMQTDGKGISKEVDPELLYKRLLEKDYEVIRSVDRDLWRLGSVCESRMIGDEAPCDPAAEFSYGELMDRTLLSELLFDHEGKHTKNKF